MRPSKPSHHPIGRQAKQQATEPIGVLQSLSSGFDFVTRHPDLMLPPILLDVFLWLGPRLSAYPLFKSLLDLLSSPDMQVVGNNSSSHFLQWFADRAGAQLPQASVISAPLWVYRLVMLLWSLWLAAQLLGWLRWGWNCLSAGGFWREKVKI